MRFYPCRDPRAKIRIRSHLWRDTFNGLLTGFQESSSAAIVNAAELDELNRKLKSSEDELEALNKRFDVAQASAKEIEKLKTELEKAKQEAAIEKATAKETATALSTLRATSDKHEARVDAIQ